jgi:hypothetical protein
MSINARYSDTVSVIVSCTHQPCMAWSQLLPHHLLNQQDGDCIGCFGIRMMFLLAVHKLHVG